MAKKKDTKIPIAPSLRALLKGESVSFPMSRYNAVRSTCTNISITEPKRFTANLDRAAGTITVTRTA